MRCAVALALVLVSWASLGCGSKKRQHRSGDAAGVELISTPGDGGARTAQTEEQEPNEGDDTATPLALGASVVGKIEPDNDVDCYRIDVVGTGALTVELPAVPGTDLSLEVRDATGAVLAKSDRGGANTKEGVPNLGVSAGRYTAVVRGKKVAGPKPPRKKKGKPAPATLPPAEVKAYEITAQVAAFAQGTEREPDEDRGTANDLILGDAVTGFLGWDKDTDVWKLSIEALSAKDMLDLELEGVAGVSLTLELADGIGTPVVVRKAPKGVGLLVRRLVPVVPQGSPPFHYLTIRSDRSNPEVSYRLTAKASPPPTDSEVEPNDTLEKPYVIPADRTTVNAQWSAGDIDCFAIPPDAAARTLEIEIDTPGEADLAAELLVDGKSVVKSDIKGKGAAEKLTGAVPANAQAIVRIRGTEIAGEGTYDVKVSEGTPPKR